ncbi:hypothetical protein CRG98_001376 [Punica granatum]|uniref:Uncharacterized protein n=1 Tax=Punica granatum TaxID=22663 RepID=A0A2I0LC00_PUNGR|nr:hypothetical protein CRG98_001376 [Punica granatum]
MGCRTWGTLNFGSPVIATLERLDCYWGSHSCTFPRCGLACAAVLGKTRRARSHEDRLVEQMSLKAVNARCQNLNVVNAGLEPKSSKCWAGVRKQ